MMVCHKNHLVRVLFWRLVLAGIVAAILYFIIMDLVEAAKGLSGIFENVARAL